MGTGGGPALPEVKNQVDVAVPHLTYEISHNLDSDGAYLPIEIIKDNTSSLSEDLEMAAEEENLLTLQNVGKTSDFTALSEAPISSANISSENFSKTLKHRKTETRTTATNSILSVRLRNAEAEKNQSDELHEIRMKIAMEDLETAKLKRRAAELQVRVAEMELKRMETEVEKQKTT